MTWRKWFGFAVMCVVSGSIWALDELVLAPFSGLLRVAIQNGFLAILFGLLAWRRGERTTKWLRIGLAAAALFAVPQVAFAAAGGHVSQLSGALIAMLAPVVVVIAVAQRSVGFGAGQSPLSRLIPAACGIGGASLLVPFDWPPTLIGQLWVGVLAGCVILAGLAAVWLHDLLRDEPLLASAAVSAAAAGLLAGAFCWLDWPLALDWTASALIPEALRCLVLDAPLLLLAVWLLGRMRPVAFSARTLLIPLVTIVESYVVMQPPHSWYTAAGMVLMALGGFGLLRGDDSTEML